MNGAIIDFDKFTDAAQPSVDPTRGRADYWAGRARESMDLYRTHLMVASQIHRTTGVPKQLGQALAFAAVLMCDHIKTTIAHHESEGGIAGPYLRAQLEALQPLDARYAVIFSAPQGWGKTKKAWALMAEFGCSSVVEEWQPGQAVQAGMLHLTNAPPDQVTLPPGCNDAVVIARGWSEHQGAEGAPCTPT